MSGEWWNFDCIFDPPHTPCIYFWQSKVLSFKDLYDKLKMLARALTTHPH
jgi:hypothetical protein